MPLSPLERKQVQISVFTSPPPRVRTYANKHLCRFPYHGDNEFDDGVNERKRSSTALEDELGISNAGLTAQTEPAILAEVMSSVTVTSLVLATSLLFLLGAGLIFSTILQGTTTLHVPWPSDTSNGDNASAILGGNVCGSPSTTTTTSITSDATTTTAVAASTPDPGGSPSAFGCTDLSPVGDSLLSYGSLDSASSSLTAAVTAERQQRYGAVFVGDFAGLHGLYGSVSLRAAFAEDDTAVFDALPEPAAVDVMLEACTDGAAGQWGECEGGWQPVLFQVRGGA